MWLKAHLGLADEVEAAGNADKVFLADGAPAAVWHFLPQVSVYKSARSSVGIALTELLRVKITLPALYCKPLKLLI